MNKKGFTLVELLGVLVILGIIVTAASLSVSSVLDRSHKKTDLLSAKEYITAINDYNTMSLQSEKIYGTLDVNDVSYTIKDAVSGSLPKGGTVTIDPVTYKVTSARIDFGSREISYSNNKYTIIDDD